MNMHVAAPISGGGKSCLVEQAAELRAARRAVESSDEDSADMRGLFEAEQKVLDTPLDTLDDIAAAVDILFSDGEPDWADTFIAHLGVKIAHAVKNLSQRAKPARRKPTPIPVRISNAELQREIDATVDLVAKLSKKKKKRIGER